MKSAIIVLVALVIASLAAALYFLVADRGGSRRMLLALTLRVALSLAVLAVLVAGHWLGGFGEPVR